MIAESPRANWYKTKNCDIYTVGNLGERYYGLAVKRSESPSPDIKILSDKILELQASGKMTLLIDRYFGDSKCYRKVFLSKRFIKCKDVIVLRDNQMFAFSCFLNILGRN